MLGAIPQWMALDNIPFNWFDAVLVGVLGVGVYCGRRNGMTKEAVRLVQWLVLVAACGLGYQPLGAGLMAWLSLDALDSYVIAYAILACVIYLIFTVIKNYLNPRLSGSNIFGGSEYYLGMPSGMIRYFCVLFAALALLNARYFDPTEIQKQEAFDKQTYGGGIYSGGYFPHLYTLQEQVFKNSASGPLIHKYLNQLLIAPTAPGAQQPVNPNAPPPAAKPPAKPSP